MSAIKREKSGSAAVFRRLFRFMRPYRVGLYAGIALALLAAALSSAAPFVLGRATDTLANIVLHGVPVPAALTRFSRLAVLLSVLYALYCVMKYWGVYLLAGVSERAIFDLRARVDDKLRRLPLRYYDGTPYGDVLSRVTNDIDVISASLQQSLEQLVTAAATAVFILVMMLVISPVLTLVGLVTIPAALGLSLLVARRSQALFRAQQDAVGALGGYVEEMYAGHTVVSAFGREEDTIASFDALSDELWSVGWKAQFLSGLLQPITQTMTNLGYVLVAVLSGWLCITGQLTVGMIQSFIQYLRQFSQPIMQTAQITNVLQSAAAAAARVFALLDEAEEPPETAHPRFPEQMTGAVTFSHVRFGYLPHQTLLRDVSLTVAPGSKVAIVGPTGAGKTTLVNLLLRFYEVTGGEIRIDSVPVHDMTRVGLRSIFGMVLQDTWLFTGTVRENIRYGKLDATDEQVERAAKAAHADHFIRALPGGYEMMLTEGASNLAQGERQLLTIARAILADCPILILDEATSSVDTRTEVLIQQAMKNLMHGRTSFVIAHRLSTIRDADQILYMEQGDIRETGTHEALMAQNGLYASLYNSQFA